MKHYFGMFNIDKEVKGDLSEEVTTDLKPECSKGSTI